jgi:hypothetical protein
MATNYDCRNVNIVVGGINIESGRNEGTFLRIENESDDYGDVRGASGEVTRYSLNDNRAKVTLTLMQASESNAALSALRTMDKLSKNGAGIVPFLVLDKNGTTMYEGEQCWIQKPPDAEYGVEPGTREWPIRVANLRRFEAGY